MPYLKPPFTEWWHESYGGRIQFAVPDIPPDYIGYGYFVYRHRRVTWERYGRYGQTPGEKVWLNGERFLFNEASGTGIDQVMSHIDTLALLDGRAYRDGYFRRVSHYVPRWNSRRKRRTLKGVSR